MPDDNSVSQWIELLRAGDHAAVGPLWEAYFARVVHLARVKLTGASKGARDEEDVALSAFDSFCRGAQADRFPQLTDRNDLWRLLVVITARKCCREVTAQRRLKRGGGTHALAIGTDEATADEILGREPTPEFAAEAAEECDRLLGLLQDRTLEDVALWKMEGYSNNEIAARLGCAARTVERKLQVIREIWDDRGTPT